MKTIQPATHHMGREMVGKEKFPNRSRAPTDVRDENSPRTLDVSRSGNLPKGFEGMLKTTTETGDIGMFSIKPSRLPLSFNTQKRLTGAFSDSSMMRQKKPFQPYGVPNIDDRRRLPSYARENSDSMSLYDSGSQKSTNRAVDEPDYRSYSMTQTSHSSYTLSNHKSYASLRSQQETPRGVFVTAGGILQRPRSPFAYPTRLRRPGFRPSSPALTDGGIVDYSRRAEIDRLAYSFGHSTSSPSSIYVMKRKPPLTLRPELNRSKSSLLSQTSPHRRSSSPQAFLNSGNDWPRRNGVASVSTSPARSTFSLSSAANIRVSSTATSVTTTPGRITPSSPLYYDYTEDFEIDEYRSPEVLPPLLFTIHKTIPEDRPISSHSLATESGGNNGLRISLPLHMQSTRYGEPLPNREEPSRVEIESKSGEDAEYGPNLQIDLVPAEHYTKIQEKKLFRLSGLGYGARELSTHVEEAFGLDASASFEVSISPGTTGPDEGKKKQTATQADQRIDGSLNNSSELSSGGFQPSSSPPLDQKILAEDFGHGVQPQTVADLLLQQPQDLVDHSSRSSRISQESIVRKDLPGHSSSTDSHRRPFTGGLSNYVGLSNLGSPNMPSGFKSNFPETPRTTTQMSKMDPTNTAIVANTLVPQNSVSKHDSVAPVCSFNEQRVAEMYSISEAGEPKQNGDYYHQLPSALPEHRPIYIPSFCRPIRVSMPLQESPMLAPKPISPVRQLKLKNSIPQLMKALPPLPQDLEFLAYPQAAHQKFAEREIARQFSSVLPSTMPETIEETGEISTVKSPVPFAPNTRSIARSCDPESYVCPSKTGYGTGITITAEEALLLAPKLKLKASNTFHNQPPSESHSWKFEDNFSWLNHDKEPASIQTQQENICKQPRFKLKVTKSSLKKQGTVRINRSSGDERQLVGLNLGNRKDLFEPVSGIESIFRKVSKHIHSRRMSTTSSLQLEDDIIDVPNLVPLRSPAGGAYVLESIEVELQPPSYPSVSYEARSCFSDDSSQEEGENSLRRRLTSLKSKIPIPYVPRAGTQSYDDITWKDRNVGENVTPAAARSIPNLHDNRASTDSKHLRRFAEILHRQRLKTKMQGWLKGARAVVVARVKPRKIASATETVQKAIL